MGKSALVERLRQELPEARWSWSMCDGLFTPRPLGPLFDLADQLGGELLERCRAGADREELFRALLAEVSAARRDGRAGRRGHPLGRRGHPRPAPLPEPAAARHCGADHRHVPGRRPGRRRPAPRRARRPRLAAVHPARRAHAAVPGRGAGTGQRERPARARAVPADRREPVLRHRGAAVGDGRGTPVGAGRGAGPGGAAERRLPRGTRRRRAHRHAGRGAAA